MTVESTLYFTGSELRKKLDQAFGSDGCQAAADAD